MNLDQRISRDYQRLNKKYIRVTIPKRLKNIYLRLEPKYGVEKTCSMLSKNYAKKDIAFMLLDLDYPAKDVAKFTQEKVMRVYAYEAHIIMEDRK